MNRQHSRSRWVPPPRVLRLTVVSTMPPGWWNSREGRIVEASLNFRGRSRPDVDMVTWDVDGPGEGYGLSHLLELPQPTSQWLLHDVSAGLEVPVAELWSSPAEARAQALMWLLRRGHGLAPDNPPIDSGSER